MIQARQTRYIRLSTLAVLLLGALPTQAIAGPENVPAQCIAKIYTEALGRAPDQESWNAVTNPFLSGCTAAQLKSLGKFIYTSSEYTGLNYSHAAKLITLYRGALNREPDSAGFNVYHQQLTAGTPWATVVDTIFASSEFAGKVSSYCATRYGWSSNPVLTVPTEGVADFAGAPALSSSSS